jgi:hypothetical protein
MHKGRRLKRLAGFFLSHSGRRQLPQFVINERKQLFRRRRIPGFDLR